MWFDRERFFRDGDGGGGSGGAGADAASGEAGYDAGPGGNDFGAGGGQGSDAGSGGADASGSGGTDASADTGTTSDAPGATDFAGVGGLGTDFGYGFGPSIGAQGPSSFDSDPFDQNTPDFARNLDQPNQPDAPVGAPTGYGYGGVSPGLAGIDLSGVGPAGQPGPGESASPTSPNFVGPQTQSFFNDPFGVAKDKTVNAVTDIRDNPLKTAINVGLGFTPLGLVNTLAGISGLGTVGSFAQNAFNNSSNPSSPTTSSGGFGYGAAGPGDDNSINDGSGGSSPTNSRPGPDITPIINGPIVLSGNGSGVGTSPNNIPAGVGANPVTPLASPLVRAGSNQRRTSIGDANYYTPPSYNSLADLLRTLRL